MIAILEWTSGNVQQYIEQITDSHNESSFIYWRNHSPSPTRKPNCLTASNKKSTATDFEGWPHTLSYISCISLNNYVSYITWLNPICTCIT